MSVTTKTIGFVIKQRGEYVSSPETRYYKDNVVQYHGSSYIANPIDYDAEENPLAYVTSAPVNNEGVLNEGWKIFASGNNTFSTGEKVTEIGIDDKPTVGSNNLVKSGGIYDATFCNVKMIPTSIVEHAAIASDGSIEEGSYLASAVITYSILSDCYIDLMYKYPPFGSPYVGLALYNNETLLHKQTIYTSSLDVNPKYYNNFGANILKICVALSKVGDVKALRTRQVSQKQTDVINGNALIDDTILLSKINNNAILSTNGYYNVLTRTSVGNNSAIAANGTIESNQYTTAGVVSHFAISPNKTYKIHLTIPAYNSPYKILALYKNGTPVKVFGTMSGVVKDYDCIINTKGLDVDELIICEKKSESGKAIISESATQADFEQINGSNIVDKSIGLTKIQDSAILSTVGACSVLERTSVDNNSAINKNGTIATSSQYMSSGAVSHYQISTNKMYKLHFTTSNFSSDYALISLYKNNSPVIVFGKQNGSYREYDCIVDTRNLDVDELLINERKSVSGQGIISESAIQYYSDGNNKNLSEIYEAMNEADVYTISQKSGKFGLIPRLFIEGLVKSDNGSAININGGDSLILEHPDYVNTDDTNHTFSFAVNADGYVSMSDQVTIHKHSPANAKNKAMRIMCIGDSLTDAGYAGVVEFIFKALNQDYGNNDINALMVGTRSDAANLTLGNYSFAVRGFNEGRSGWAISDYLRHFNVVTADKTQWDILGLGTMTRNGVPTRTYEEYTGSDAQKELMRTTCHGWYDADPSERLWTWLKTSIHSTVFSGSFVYDGVTYDLGSSYSSNADAAIVAAVKLICSSSTLWKPCPFYDYDTVQSSNGQYAFNLETYLNRYKTIDSDGITRLVAGSTAGTWVDNVNNYDVCEPTHVVIIMNENDARWISSGTPVADDLKLCADLVAAYDNTIKISIGSTRGYGAFRPSSYNSDGYVGNFYVSNRRLQTWTALKSVLQNTNYDLLPLYAMQSVIGVGGGRAFDTLDQKSKFNMVGDRLHTGESAMSYLDRAYLVAAWVINTLV